jgi:hypothetical protein
MLFGHNSNVSVGDSTFHVQTEDRGLSQALIDTTVYLKGRVLHRRTNNYLDLLPLDPQKEAVLKDRLDQQHRSVVADISSGALKLTQPLAGPVTVTSPPAAAVAPPPPELTLKLKVLNAKGWLSGKHASLHVGVHDKMGNPIPKAKVTATLEGTPEQVEASVTSGADGQAVVEFDLPRLSGAEPMLVVEASWGLAKGYLRFQLRPKTKVPAS